MVRRFNFRFNCFIKKADPHTSLLCVHMVTVILSNKSISNLIFPPEYLLVWLRRVYIALLAVLQSCMFASIFPLLEITVPKYVYDLHSSIGLSLNKEFSSDWWDCLFSTFIVLVFFVLTLSFHLSQYVCNFFKQFWRPNLLSDTRIRLSAYNRQFTKMSANWAGWQEISSKMLLISLIN